MTVEIERQIQETFPVKSSSICSDQNENFNNTSENIGNVSPSTADPELMVAVRPAIISHAQLLNSKIAITTLNSKNIEQNILLSKELISPVKRPNIHSSPDAPLAKRLSISSMSSADTSPSLPSSPSRLLSQSAGHSSQLQSAIKHVQTNLSQSCFADLRSKRSGDIDSDLTCLNWLQEGNLLNGFAPGKKEIKKEGDDTEEKTEQTSQDNSDLNLLVSDPLNSINEVDKSLRKPAYSFSTLIFMAIENAKDKRLPVKEIYQWIQDNFPYFQKAPIGWKNSVRHNLSLNKSFKKVDKEKCVGKGSLWTIDHEARAGLVQQLRKTATYHSYPYSILRNPHRYYSKDRHVLKRDATGRFLPNHDDAEFDVAAAMCSLSSPSLSKSLPTGVLRSYKTDEQTSIELLKFWRTHIEPWEDSPTDENEEPTDTKVDSKLTIHDFLDEVRNKLSFKPPVSRREGKHRYGGGSLNTSSDADYEFYVNSDEEDDSSDEDEEMKENMRRLVEKEKDDDSLFDSGYSEEGTLKSATVLDHSYSKSIQSLCRPHTKRESKGVSALLSLADAASKELESLCKDVGSASVSPEKNTSKGSDS